MIAVDTNVLLYLYIPGPYTDDCTRLLKQDPVWACPPLWRSEFCNTLLLYLRKKLIVREFALSAIDAAEKIVSAHEYLPATENVMDLAIQNNCTYYDCEFVATAQSLSTILVTQDRAVLKAFPSVAMTISAALQRP